MGWNHWYAHYDRVTDAMMREAADILIRSGMADVGFQFVNIDDCWMNASNHSDPLRVGPFRNAHGNILPNRHFPHMKALTDYMWRRKDIGAFQTKFTCEVPRHGVVLLLARAR